MEEQQYLDWEGLQLYDRYIKNIIQKVNNLIKNQKITFTKNGNEVSSFSVDHPNINVEILNDQDILNIIRYGQSDISNFNEEQLESSIFAKVAKTGNYSDLNDYPTKLSDFENDGYVTNEQLNSILGYDDNKTIQDIIRDTIVPITHSNVGEGTLDSEKQIDSLFNN